jgi:hypothetical protein
MRPGTYKRTAAHRKRISESAKARVGAKNPFFGKHHSEETKQKISLAKTGVAKNAQQRSAHRRQYNKQWVKNNPQKVAAWDAQQLIPRALRLKRKRRDNRNLAIEKLGGKCSSPGCRWLNPDGTLGCNDKRLLQIDHKNGGGTQERARLSYDVMLRQIVEGNLAPYQLLCACCNWLKAHTNNEFASMEKYETTRI